ncbi:MAG: bifunctional 4-hydroxy-2-oxoglutarate aldolase/2-dehydro-3-deoxy-phosphogluconate aldolase [Bacillota bacterium]|nr:bifunctional 4-hydroxy-2-oxoglutarate aldolase/2-dehydro-3-deoxy-phosphogluconate aldolase [Bacillota bacterium]
MDKEKCRQKIEEDGLIAVIRAQNKEEALLTACAVQEGGAGILEVTMTVPGAVEVIEHLVRSVEGEVIIGAGTVLDVETAAAVIEAGASFVVSPCLIPELVRFADHRGILVMPGAMTPTEIFMAMEAGAEMVKVFPGSVLGPNYIKAVLAPMPRARLVPTGGVNLDNVGNWIKKGAAAVGVGSELTGGAKTGDYEVVRDVARRFLLQIKEARQAVREGS